MIEAYQSCCRACGNGTVNIVSRMNVGHSTCHTMISSYQNRNEKFKFSYFSAYKNPSGILSKSVKPRTPEVSGITNTDILCTWGCDI